jgi:hypothetical protein
MTDETYNKYDLLLKAVGAVGLVVTAAFGVVEYVATSNGNATLETNKLDSDQHKLYFDKQLEYYVKATETVAAIANTSDAKTRQELVRNFDVMYYGPMVMFEERADAPHQAGEKYTNDINVEKHMVAIHECIQRNCSNAELQVQSLGLADACRYALSVNWQNRVQNLRQGLNLKERLGFKEKDN